MHPRWGDFQPNCPCHCVIGESPSVEGHHDTNAFLYMRKLELFQYSQILPVTF